MDTALNPYINFKDNTREAMTFYHGVFGGKLTMNTFKDFGAAQTPEEEPLIMHAALEGEGGISFFASDTPARMELRPGNNFSMSLSGGDEAALRGWWEKLAEGAEVTMPLEKAVWGDTFGMLTDRFGVTWLVNIHVHQG